MAAGTEEERLPRQASLHRDGGDVGAGGEAGRDDGSVVAGGRQPCDQAADAVPRCQLGGDEDAVAMSGSRLGWTTWLGGGPPHDRGDAMFAVG